MTPKNWDLFSTDSPFSTFLRYSNQKRTAFKNFASHITKENTGWCFKDNVGMLYILDIGCGSGEVTTQVSVYVRDLFGKMPSIYLLDPSNDLLHTAIEKLIQLGFPRSSIKFEAAPFTPQDDNSNLLGLSGSSHFHLILCSHVLYYVEDWIKATTGMLRLIDGDGLIWVTMQSEKGEQYQFRKTFIPKLTGANSFSKQSAEEYCRLLDSLKIPFTFETQASHISLPLEFELTTSNFINPPLSEDTTPQIYDLIRLMEFLLRRDWREVPLEIKMEVLDLLREKQNNKSHYIEQFDGFIWVSNRQ